MDLSGSLMMVWDLDAAISRLKVVWTSTRELFEVEGLGRDLTCRENALPKVSCVGLLAGSLENRLSSRIPAVESYPFSSLMVVRLAIPML